MNAINWKVRIKNKMFWIAVIPAVLLLVQTVCSVFGIELDFGDLQDKLLAVINALFLLHCLQVLGLLAGFVQPQECFVRVVDQGDRRADHCRQTDDICC